MARHDPILLLCLPMFRFNGNGIVVVNVELYK